MADSKKLRVLKALCDHLKTIDPATGFDVTNAVFRGRATFGDETPIPAISILDNLKPDIGLYAAENDIKRNEDWILLLQGWTKDNKQDPTDEAFNFMAVTEQKLSEVTSVNPKTGEPAFPDAYMLSGLISDMRIGPGVARPPQEGLSSRAFFWLPLTVSLYLNLADPFGQ